MSKLLLLCAFSCFATTPVLWAQTDTLPPEEEEDYSKYENMQVIDPSTVKRYCTSKVFGQTPNRLIGIGYEFVGPYSLTTQLDPGQTNSGDEKADIRFSQGIRLEANFPVISRNNFVWSLGGSYLDHYYSFKSKVSGAENPVAATLQEGSIRNLSAVTTLFKPLNEKSFLLGQMQADYAGDWTLTKWQSPAFIKVSATAIYGRKPHDRYMWGVGITRTYRAGEVNYLPVFLLNYSAPNQKWGVEMLLPARGDFRYNFSTRNMLRLGFELEGTSYRINDWNDHFAKAYPNQTLDRLELRRSDIRLRAIWDFPLKDFYWCSLSVGYRIVYRYDIDNGEFFRGFFGDQPYVATNQMSGGVFVSAIFNLVSP